MRKDVCLSAILLFLGHGLLCQTTHSTATNQEPGSHQSKSMDSHASTGITESQADAILDELRKIRTLLEKQQTLPAQAPAPSAAAPQHMSMMVSKGWYSLGPEDAPLTLIEFTDYECPFCRNFQSKTFAELKKNYIDTGKLHFINYDLPLDFHAHALVAAEAVRCAGDQGKFWEMRDALINTSDLSRDAIVRQAQTLSLDAVAFRTCLDTEKYKSEIQKDQADAASMQISGTPTFILGRVTNHLLSGDVIVGAQPYESFENAIKQQLTK